MKVFKEKPVGFIYAYNISFYVSSLKLSDISELALLHNKEATLRNSDFTFTVEEFYKNDIIIVIP